MYLHIGKDYIIKNKDIIGIFNMDYIKNTKEYREMYKSMEEDEVITTIGDQPKTFIITENNKKIKGYITNISTTTIGKRKM